LAAVGAGTKLLTAAGRWSDLARADRLRAGATLIARGEFSLAIAGVAVTSGVEPRLAPLAIAYVMILAVVGPIAARIAAAATASPRGREQENPP
jgi:CPA2 family monovalent cation:H+ antiporter-2